MRIWKRYVIFTLFVVAGHFFLESDKLLIGTKMYERTYSLAFVMVVIGCALWYTWHESNIFQITASDILPEDPTEAREILEEKWKEESAERRWKRTVFPSACVFACAIMYDLLKQGVIFSFPGFCVLAFYACIFIQLMFKEPNKILKYEQS